MRTFIAIYKALKTSRIKLYLFILIVLTISLNILSLTINFFRTSIEMNIINRIENRLIYVSYNSIDRDGYKDIISLKHIQNVYLDIEPINSKSNEFGDVYIKFINPNININLNSKSINGLGYNEIAIPKDYVNDTINKKDVIGKKTIFTIDNTDYELTISDVYISNDKSPKYVYISSNSDLNQYIECKEYIVLVDEKKNVRSVQKELNELGCEIKYISDSFQTESSVYTEIIKYLDIFLKTCYVLLIVIFSMLVFSNINEKKYSIALLKTLGYSDLYLLYVIVLTFFLMFFLAFFISFLINGLIHIIFINIFDKNNYFNLSIIIKNFCFTTANFMFVTLFSLYKIRKVDIIRLLKK